MKVVHAELHRVESAQPLGHAVVADRRIHLVHPLAAPDDDPEPVREARRGLQRGRARRRHYHVAGHLAGVMQSRVVEAADGKGVEPLRGRRAGHRPMPVATTRRRGHLGLQSHAVYEMHMARTNVDIDDRACGEVMRRYRLRTKREAVNFALRKLAAEPLDIVDARRLRGSGWEGDLEELRRSRAT